MSKATVCAPVPCHMIDGRRTRALISELSFLFFFLPVAERIPEILRALKIRRFDPYVPKCSITFYTVFSLSNYGLRRGERWFLLAHPYGQSSLGLKLKEQQNGDI